METERLTYNVKETARLLGVSKNSCYEAIRRGELPSLRVGRRVLIPRNQLERLLSSDIQIGGIRDDG
jgi:excisionase family DNA binding protein